MNRTGGEPKKWPLGNVREPAVDGLLQEMRADSYAVKTNISDCHQMFCLHPTYLYHVFTKNAVIIAKNMFQ